MTTSAPQTIYLKDYAPPDFLVESIDLRFELDEENTTVVSHLEIVRNAAAGDHDRALELDGHGLTLEDLKLDGRRLGEDAYELHPAGLRIPGVPSRFELEVTTVINPAANTSLEGLYTSSGNFCTQCEAEGFRKITYFPDRPDVMSRYATTIVADRDRYPVLLSNGNPVSRGESGDNRHWVTWEDPFPKPCYLFALVAGDLVCVEDRHTTRSGREVRLQIFVERHNIDKCDHAMASLKRAMQWDEEIFGLEYDLSTYMIVAVDDFNMGAMENKGLNIFNSKYVLARPDTATDADYAGIEGVIAHEYFHNWTGNRVTCRDWFQLSLKEGLTVFRDQEFSADVGSRPVKRIQDVRILRAHQFAEDAGPMAHPVRPDSYMEISNFYTVTVYNKGAEVIRMMHNLLGVQGFRAGMDLYFERHDGQAVTTDDFVRAMEDATGRDLGQFRRWYDQAGTPVISVRGEYDPSGRRYTLEVEQRCPPTPGQPDKAPYHIPLTLGLLGPDGDEIPVRLEGEPADAADSTRVLELREARERFTLVDVPAEPVPSLLRGFSAPVRLDPSPDDAALAFLMGNDADPFTRWDAGQSLAVQVLHRLMDDALEDGPLVLDPRFAEATGRLLSDTALDRAFVAEALALPTESYLGQTVDTVHVEAIHAARQFLRRALAAHLRPLLEQTYGACQSNEPYRFDTESAGRRSLKNACLGYLAALDEPAEHARCMSQFRGADNMTDSLAALGVLSNLDIPDREEALETFQSRWSGDPLVLDKWFAIQATSHLPGTLDTVNALMGHPAFSMTNPNKVRALIGAFANGNQLRFHAPDGSGYAFLADRVLELDPLNPQIAARLVGALNRWRRFDAQRQAHMRRELERVLAAPSLSRDTYEIASKALA